MKKLFFGMAVVAAATFGAYNANKTNADSQMSDLQMENLEIIAEGESGNGLGTLYGNAAGTRYCCASGSNSCSAAPCPW